MKKILFALVAIALVAVSCKKNPTDPKKDDPTTADCTFTITVSDVTSHEAVVSFVPSIKDVTWYATVYAATDLEGMTDEEITTEFYDYFDEYKAYMEQIGAMMGMEMNLHWSDMVYVGDQELAVQDLDGGTTWTVVAFQVDSVNRTNYKVSKQNFTTEEADPNENYLSEPTTTTTFNFAPTEVTATYSDADSFFIMDIEDDNNTFVLCVGANYTAKGAKTGTFNVSMDDKAVGSVWGSAGFDGQYIYRTFMGEFDAQGYVTDENGIYFVTGGSMTVSDNGLTASFTTKFGSTINVNFEGEIDWVDAATLGAPAKVRKVSEKVPAFNAAQKNAFRLVRR